MMNIMLCNYGVIDSIKEARNTLCDALKAKSKHEMKILVAEAMGIVATINNLIVEVEDNTEECE